VLTLSAFDERQRPLGQTVQVTLAIGEAMRKPVADLFQIGIIQTFPPPVMSGFIRISPAPLLRPIANPPIVGSIEVYLTDGGVRNDSMLYAISGSARKRWIVPFLTTSAPYYSGYTLLSSEKANVLIDRFASDGLKTGGANVISTGPLRFSQVFQTGT